MSNSQTVSNNQAMSDWKEVAIPAKAPIDGHYVTLEPLGEQHVGSLWHAYQGAEENWRYLPISSFENQRDFSQWVTSAHQSTNTLYYAIVEKTGKSTKEHSRQALGIISYLRIDTSNGAIEIGNLNFSPLLKKTRMATDALYLMIKHAFSLGYRRVEWKCDDNNQPSKKAAQRLGFTFEGVFRQHRVVKGHNRDTAWFSILDHEWPRHRAALEHWLEEDNFTAEGEQQHSLAYFRKHHFLG